MAGIRALASATRDRNEPLATPHEDEPPRIRVVRERSVLPGARQGGVGLIATPVEGDLLRVEGTRVGMPAHTAGLLPGELVRVSSAELGDVGGVVHIERVLTGESVSRHRALFDALPGIPQLQDINGAPFVGFWSPQGALAL